MIMNKKNQTIQHKARNFLVKENYDLVLHSYKERVQIVKNLKNQMGYIVSPFAFSIAKYWRKEDVNTLSPYSIIQVKATANPKVNEFFDGMKFQITQNEKEASECMGGKYLFALVNLREGIYKYNQVEEIMKRATNFQEVTIVEI